jgi:CDP-diglyceride synthetase
MSILRKSYKRYSLGLVIAWAIALGLVWLLKGSAQFHTAFLVCMGFFLGWLSTTIARNVYPKQPGLLG